MDEFTKFLESRDPESVAREWTNADLRTARAEGILMRRRIAAETQTLVRVYTKASCIQCDMTKRELRKHGIEFVEDSIMDPGNLAAAKAMGLMSAPVVVAGDDQWAGFQPDRIKALAKRLKGEK